LVECWVLGLRKIRIEYTSGARTKMDIKETSDDQAA